MSNSFSKLRSLNVNDRVEKKDGLTYLSWAWAWDEFKQHCPDATYEVVKAPSGLPYFESEAGAMVFTKVTAGGETHEMWLPVMDGKNKVPACGECNKLKGSMNIDEFHRALNGLIYYEHVKHKESISYLKKVKLNVESLINDKKK